MDDVLVLGAGVIGLTTAVCLAEAGLTVRIRTAQLPQATTSVVAGAMWGRGPGVQEPADRIDKWMQVSLGELTELADDPTTGVRFARGREATREPDAPTPIPGARDTRRCTKTELPAGFADGYWITVPLVDMPRHLAYLEARFRAAGGQLEQTTVRDETTAPVVVNCTGVGARELVPDPAVVPIRGQHVIVTNPGLTEFFVEETDTASWVSLFPHGDRVVLGGVAVRDSWDLAPDPLTADAIVARCAEVEPRLKDAEVRAHLVGLRPGRSAVRLDEEQRNGTRWIHNYGHGGMGVTLSWGCAHEVVTLVDQPFR
ncbi:MAG TPA: FAD-dependent oxidoreductase [Pseudonocardiaceae bacterium]|nr:FAD-dependent oxidoreductase [Pseudonocardiaceae bacterium]